MQGKPRGLARYEQWLLLKTIRTVGQDELLPSYGVVMRYYEGNGLGKPGAHRLKFIYTVCVYSYAHIFN